MLKWLGGLVDSNEKELKQLKPVVDRVNELEDEFEKLGDDELRGKTDEFKKQLKSGSSLDELLPQAFAAVREAAKRTIGQRHFDVQLMGGVVLHQGKIAEMKTGEGKTLVATLPLYLNSLGGQGCHLVTVNDYLARRDPYWMGPIYHALGVSVASIYPQQTPDEPIPARLYDPDFDSGDDHWRHFRPIPRREAYEADIVYGTSSDFGFDYLRDNMVVDLSRCVQRRLNYAIVDEVDNLLIDEARTPLIISGAAEEAAQKYHTFARFVPRLRSEQDYTVDEKTRTVNLTDAGITTVEKMLKREGLLKSPDLYDPTNHSLTRYLDSALKAYVLYKRDRDYVVKDGQVIIVDEFTGRLMLGRRYSEGLHQALEAKEGVKVQRESMTYATITIQNYFRMYQKLSGMTGTALTEAEEFHKIYKLEVVVIPTHKPMIRLDSPDQIYKDEMSKFKATVREIEQLHQQEQPVLIGTVSIEKSELLSDLLKKKGIPHQVLNAKHHEKEAHIITQAGQPGAVTVATNMAGRGVDIVLGGSSDGQGEAEWQKQHNKVVELGGLHIIGTERHEARRIDNQLRGRAGRQGDPGSSRFYVSLEDDVVHRFGGERIKGIMDWAGLDENTPIENALVNKAIENAQVQVEGYHFDMRKHLVEYDDVINKQREVIYSERQKILSGADLKTNILTMVKQEIEAMVAAHTGDGYDTSQNIEALIADVVTIFPLPPEVNASALSQLKPEQIEERLTREAEALYEKREGEFGSDKMRVLERLVMLRIIDNLWVEHLTIMENMRQGIGLMAAGQRDPLVAYKRQGHNLFGNLLSTIQHDVAHTIYHASIVQKQASQPAPSRMAQVAAASTGSTNKQPLKAGGKKVGRNDPCPCGSGKKYKKCCGR
ncbi:MAG: preprotein translocase subunit SecA [Dehalococcoidia bacterium]|nr:MAG: preprotein translocase subunit SecA [Dehalococcoidia bacterium]